MVRKRTSLDSVLPPPSPKPKATPRKVSSTKTTEAESQGPVAMAKGGRRPNVKQPALYLKHPVHRQLRVLAFEEEKKMHDLFLEAIDMLFAERGLPSIAELEATKLD